MATLAQLKSQEIYNKLHSKKIKQIAKKYYKKYGKEIYKKHKQQQLNYQREMRKVAREVGNCSVCFKENDNLKYKRCNKCRAYYRDYYERRH